MGMKRSILVNQWRIERLNISVIALCKLVAPSEARYCANIVFIVVYKPFLSKNYKCARKTFLVVPFSSQSIKTSSVISLLSCYASLNSLHTTNLRTDQPQNLGNINNSQHEPQFYWFL